MNILFRADASIQIGTGHIMRCLTLADMLKANSKTITFITNKDTASLSRLILERGYFHETILNNLQSGIDEWKTDAIQTIEIIKKMSNPVDLLVVDHYMLDTKWEEQLKGYANRLMVIDDLANRKHYCDFLLDQNFYLNLEDRYNLLVPRWCKKLLGPKFALLRQEFKSAKDCIQRSEDINRILVFFGGTDPTGETIKVLQAFQKINLKHVNIDVVTGVNNPKNNEIRELCDRYQYNYFCQINNMAEFMCKADLSIGAGGSTTWERCMLGLASITIAVAENQIEILKDLQSRKVVHHLGWWSSVSEEDVISSLKLLMNNKEYFYSLQENSINIMGDNHKDYTEVLL